VSLHDALPILIKGLNINPHGTYVDCTVGGGGHSGHIVRELDDGMLIAFDQDHAALKAAQEKLKPYQKNMIFIHSNFKNLEEKLIEKGIQKVDEILFDLGVYCIKLDCGVLVCSYHIIG